MVCLKKKSLLIKNILVSMKMEKAYSEICQSYEKKWYEHEDIKGKYLVLAYHHFPSFCEVFSGIERFCIKTYTQEWWHFSDGAFKR